MDWQAGIQTGRLMDRWTNREMDRKKEMAVFKFFLINFRKLGEEVRMGVS